MPVDRSKDIKRKKDGAGLPARFNLYRALVKEKLEGGNQPTSRPPTRGHQELGELADALMEQDQTKASQILDQHPNKYSPESSRKKLTQRELLTRLSKETDRILLENRVLRPSLPDETKRALDQLKMVEKEIREKGTNPLSGEEYVQLIENTLEKLSPETMQYYRDHKVKFVSEEGDPGWTPNGQNEQGEWEVRFPRGKKPFEIMLRAIEVPLQIDHRRDGSNPGPERRIEVMASVFKANEMLGQAYQSDITGYALAEQYHRDYHKGIEEAIKKAFDKEGIDYRTIEPKEVQASGHEYARTELAKTITPPPGIREVLVSFGPAAYFEEKKKAIDQGQQPVEVGTLEFNGMLEQLADRKRQGGDSSLTVNILLDKRIMVQPSLLLDNPNIKSTHPVNSKGNHSAWAGEVEIEGNKLLRIKQRSGHFRPGENLFDFAVSAFKDKGFNVDDVKKEPMDTRDA